MANSPAVLRGCLMLDGALNQGILSRTLRERIALTVAEINSCQYCIALHSVQGEPQGLAESEIQAAGEADSEDPKTAAALRFARNVVEYRGDLTDEEFELVRRAGYSDEEIVEIIAHIALNIYTNYMTSLAQTELDLSWVDMGGGDVA
jgi:uncharacterized peroxidase-related enzyme